jgi:transcriptional regulator with XRE-family HTH domain
MASVGERLKVERESRNTTLEEMVVATGIGQSYLDALERDAIHELPGKAFGKLYIRAYAEVFGFDPQPWIDDYDREQRLAQGPSTEPTRSAPVGSRPVAEAIARWKAERAAAEKAEPIVVEPVVPETVSETAPEEDGPETVTEPEPATEPVPETVTVPEIAPEPTPNSAPPVVVHEAPLRVPAGRRFIGPLLVLGVVVVAAAIYFGMSGTKVDPQDKAPIGAATTSVTASRIAPSPEPRPVEPPAPAVAKPPATPPSPAPAPSTTSAGSELTVSESGVGLRVVNLRLEGESDHFAEGVRVCFASRVLGGQRGDRIRHVWLYEGRVEQSIALRLGGPDFRTHSNKTLGHAGRWAVEARDERGSVLARVDFTCGPPAQP